METLLLYLIDTNEIEIDHIIKSKYISSSMLEKLSRITNERARKEAIASLYLKNKYIGEYYLNEKWKPLSNNTYFNISHSFGLVLLIKDEKNEIGIDVEKIRETKQKLIDFVCSSKEKSCLKSDQDFYEIWTNKEAISKAEGDGLSTDLKEISALPINGIKTYKGKQYLTKTIIKDGYVISVARESLEDFNLEIINENID
ncbi:MAG: 4'-phosphopantetheinyl transferase superfamily protein [Bacilli bacterium]|nr:4'-phosphopantetheinyl transferase superfamily protein [Bacilli bacterium]